MTVFVAGVHAVGKTYAAQPACEALGVRYATASQLIREERGLVTWDSSKQVSEVEQNQIALVSAIRQAKNAGEVLVLDGHFVLRKSVGVHERLPVEVFCALGCSGVLLLSCRVSIVADRLRARGDNSWTEEELTVFSTAEREHARHVSHALSIPLIELDEPGTDKVRLSLDSLIRQTGLNSGSDWVKTRTGPPPVHHSIKSNS